MQFLPSVFPAGRENTGSIGIPIFRCTGFPEPRPGQSAVQRIALRQHVQKCIATGDASAVDSADT
jgi:hypothetical protein